MILCHTDAARLLQNPSLKMPTPFLEKWKEKGAQRRLSLLTLLLVHAHLPLYRFSSMTEFTGTDAKHSLREIDHMQVVNHAYIKRKSIKMNRIEHMSHSTCKV